MKTRTIIAVVSLAVLAGTSDLRAEDNSKDLEAYNQLLRKVQTNPARASEEDILQLLEAGKELNRSYTTSLAVRGYFSRNFQPSSKLLRLAAENAFLAADYRTAAARYKAYLSAVEKKGNGESKEQVSRAAGALYRVLIDFLEAEDDAYQFMSVRADRYRQTPAARKYDTWLLRQARKREDHATHARMLSAIFEDKIPLEKERLYYWDDLDALIRTISDPRSDRYPALPYCKRLAGMIRDDETRQLRMKLAVAQLQFKASSAGKDDETLTRIYTLVTEAAEDYFKADRSAATVKDICRILAGGIGGFSEDAWKDQLASKQKMFAEMFQKLSTDDQAEIISWRDGSRSVARNLASDAQWALLIGKSAREFAGKRMLMNLSFDRKGDTLDDYVRQAKLLKGVPSHDAAIINSIAAGGFDAHKALDHLGKEELWHCDPDAIDNIAGQIIEEIKRLAEKAGKEIKNPDAAWVSFGRKYLTTSPAVYFADQAAEKYLDAAWRYSGKEEGDKSQFADHLEALAWVPWSRRTREDVFNDAHRDYRGWVSHLRRKARDDKADIPQAQMKIIDRLEKVFNEVRKDESGDPSSAPNNMCKQMALLLKADNQRDRKAYVPAGKELLKELADYHKKRIPGGRAVMRYLVRKQNGFDSSELNLAVLADQVQAIDGTDPRSDAHELIDTFVDSYRWEWGRIEDRYADTAKSFNSIVGEALLKVVKSGRFDPRLMNWFRMTRDGRGWNIQNTGNKVMQAIIDRKAIHGTGYTPGDRTRSATCTYMYLVSRDFPKLQEKYPPATWFDDMYIEEARKTGSFDYSYWQYGKDSDSKVAKAAADAFARYDRVPFGYGDTPERYSRGEFWEWLRHLSGIDAVRDDLLARTESYYGKTRFDTYAMGWAYFTNPRDVEKPEGRKKFFQELDTLVQRLIDAPARPSLPYMGELEKLSPKDLTTDELDVLVRIFPHATPSWWPRGWNYDRLGIVVHDALVHQGRQAELYEVLGHLWKIGGDVDEDEYLRALAERARSFAAGGQFDLALVSSLCGLELASDALPEDARTQLTATKSSAISKVGAVIPVEKSDPRYPAFAAQAAYLVGKEQTAWQTYLENSAKILATVKDLDPEFCIWLIDKNTEVQRFDASEEFARVMLQWFDSTSDGFEPEIRARLNCSYANISFAKEEYAKARALYNAVAESKDFEGTRSQQQAKLRIAEVDRVTRQFEPATKLLETLARSKDSWLRAEAMYQLAKVQYDQELYTDAKDTLAKVFVARGEHPEARILEGRINLKLNKLEDPTDLRIGPVSDKRLIVPGMPLKVSLEDRNLSVVGKSSNIEISAWTDSGDRETFLLTPFGDSRTNFRGQVPTEIAKASPGDHVLQLLGNDRVHYDFSEKFKKTHKITENVKSSLTVATASELYASSGTILSREQREQRALEEKIRQKMELKKESAQQVALSTVRGENQVKPGNKVNVRVIDPDRSVTDDVDTVSVKVASSSGDAIASFTLKETGTHTGVFEGAVLTAAGQAIATASDSQEGKFPNFAISRNPDYPAWVALPDNQRPKTFSVDLNTSAKLGRMKVIADVPARGLKKFLVQTSLNGEDFRTVGSWPERYVPWDGRPELTACRYPSSKGPRSVGEIRHYLTLGHVATDYQPASKYVTMDEFSWDHELDGIGRKIGLDKYKDDRYYVAKVAAAFFQPRRQIRTFRLMPAGDRKATYFLVVDGQVASSSRRTEEDFIEVQKKLTKGVHRVEIYVFANGKDKVEFQLHCDKEEAPYMGPCPAEMFDVEKNPVIAEGINVPVATVQADQKKETFEISFAPPSDKHPDGTQARVVRLALLDFETDAPAIRKIELTDFQKNVLLPTKEDFLELRKNQQLEIVPGDRISVTYEDPKVIKRGQELREAFLQATYANATISACFVEYDMQGGLARPRYIPMYRFKPGDTVKVFIRDPDCDVSDKPDRIKFLAWKSMGSPVEIDALETAEHSGVFLGTLFPVDPNAKETDGPGKIVVDKGDDIFLRYNDRENTAPGIPWPRETNIEQTWFKTPEVRVYSVKSEKDPAAEKAGEQEEALGASLEEQFPASRKLVATRPADTHYDKPATACIGGPVLVEVLFPSAAQSPASTISLFAQTSSARRKAGKDANDAFDIRVPGTLKLTSRPGSQKAPAPGPGYTGVEIIEETMALSPLELGRFCFQVPVELGAVPERSYAVEDELSGAGRMLEKPTLKVSGSDTIYVALKYTDPETGKEHWLEQTIVLDSDAFFDIMDRRYQKNVDGLYVGQRAYFRVIDASKDLTDGKDIVKLSVKTESGKTTTIELMETFSHSGIFKGLTRMVYADEEVDAAPGDVVPVVYGDVVTVSYPRERKLAGLEGDVEIFKGSDGEVIPFTKRFKDSSIAVRTQFLIAEAYFELAKRHRQLGDPNLAAEEILAGKKTLEEAIRDYPDTDARAQADYLLANLALEFGNEMADARDTAAEAAKKAGEGPEHDRYLQQVEDRTDRMKKYYAEAVTRFSDIVSTFPESEYAPKAQFKKALTYEKMGQIDQACEEYVKLSYRYPENELVARTIARLGNYFLTKGKMMRDVAKAQEDQIEREKMLMQARKFFKTAGQVLGRLQKRFPAHDLAGKTLVLSAQCYMHAEEYDLAVETFLEIVDDAKKYDPDLVAEGMYWCGDSYMKTEEYVEAYRMFKRLTWDYPASMWAKYARGVLADERLSSVAGSEDG